MTYSPSLAKVKVDSHTKNQGHRSNGSSRRVHTDRQTNGQTDATKRTISLASRSIITVKYIHFSVVETISNVNVLVSDAEWHTVKWELMEGKLDITLDDVTLQPNADVTPDLLHEQSEKATIYMGARPRTPG